VSAAAVRGARVPGVVLATAIALAAVFAFEVALARRVEALASPDLVAAAVVVDLVLVVPLAVAWSVARRAPRRAWVAAPLAVVGAIVAELALPAAHAGPARLAGWILVPAELAVVAGIAVVAARTVRRARLDASAGADFVAVLRDAAARVVPGERAPAILAYEVAMLAYALGLAPRQQPSPGETAVTHHRRAAYPAIVGALIVAGVAEMVGVHVLLARWSPAAAWIVTGLSFYTGVWVLADLRAMSRRPTVVADDGIRFRLGLRGSMDVPWDALAGVERIGAGAAASENRARPLRMVAIGAPTHRVTLRRPLVAQGPYAFRRAATEVEVAIDDPEAFETALAGRVAPLR